MDAAVFELGKITDDGADHGWLKHLENEEIEADLFWRKRNCVGVYYSRRGRHRSRRNESCEAVPGHGADYMASTAAKGGLGEPVVASDLRAPHGCKPIGRLRYPVVALKEAPYQGRF